MAAFDVYNRKPRPFRAEMPVFKGFLASIVVGGSMASGGEGVLTLTVRVKVSPEAGVVGLLARYRDALNYSIRVIIENKVLSLGSAHRLLYSTLKERFSLPSKVAQDCYREALAIAKSWLRNPRRGRLPRVRSLRMWLTHGAGYRIRDGYVEIIGGIKLKIIGWDRRYDQYESREARLVYKDRELYLMVSKKVPKPPKYNPRGALAVDINEKHIAVGNSEFEARLETAVERALHYRMLAENLQRKYSSVRYPAWLRRRGIRERIGYFHEKAKNIIEDWARKTSHEIVMLAKHNQYAVAREDLTNLVESLRKLPREHRVALLMLSYRRLEHWINWQAEKHGVPVIVVDPAGTSSTCLRCGGRLKENSYRTLKCPVCGFEDDRDTIAVLNIEKRAISKMGGSLTAPTAPQMTDVTPNRCGEPVNPLKGTLALQGGEEVR